ncbi:CAP domain-containing protein [Roseofilum sp. BLCC_M154]|uniref:CAP domain-containing protein n=1 Tax=Roseofilum acuticapitatum BLCC-M154 TaxID=3022444 RepID=A0ABT7ASD3_9CYAN|nr:CAP domain-containing protein [Roseofilum acuticapitatum]MDJ1169811.1 CAP domain-containing protein [Roseofilum acuticapitatum BLCC-M154]
MSQEFINRVVELTNFQRSQFGLPPLVLNAQLTQAAQVHTQNMAFQDFFSHTGLDGSSVGDRINATGYQASTWAENIGTGYQTPEQVVDGWMNSPGHRANILNANVQEIGVGYFFLANDTGNVNYNYYWTQVFGDPLSGVVTPAPTPTPVNPASPFTLGTDANDQIVGTAGNDTIFALGGDDIATGNSGNDYVNGNLGNDQVAGDGGNDSVRGGQGFDFVTGGEGNDFVFGDRQNDQVFGDNGDDILYGGQNEDYLDGGAGNDILYGDLGSDVMIGGAGNDIFVLRTGATDLIFYNDSEDYIGLGEGLSFNSLTFNSGSGELANATLIYLAGTTDILAILPNIAPNQLDPGDFVAV